MKIERRIADNRLYGDRRDKANIKYIVVQTIENRPTAHYHVVNGEAIQLVPDGNMSNSVNGGKLSPKGILHGICTKYNSISIGLPYNLTPEDIQTCIKLIMTIKQRYNVENENVIRQMDITGEPNPERWFKDDKWNQDIKSNLIDVKGKAAE